MKKILLILLLGHVGYSVFSQGSWNIGYVEVDSITTSHVGKSVKIDFKHSDPKNKQTPKWVRSYVTPQDSATIAFDEEELTLIEKRKIYADHGAFDDQYLEILDQDKLFVKRIYETKLIEIADSRLKFLISIDAYDKQSKGHNEKISSKVKEVWIDKGILDGLMIKI